MRKLLVTDGLRFEGCEILKAHPKIIDLKYFDSLSARDLLREIEFAEAVLIRTATKLNADVLARAKNLKLIVRAGVGVDHIDLSAAKKLGIAVTHTPEESADTVSEFTVGLVIAAARNFQNAHHAIHSGDWTRAPLVGMELKSKTIGILGFGRIGRRVGARLKSFEMNIIACDPYIPKAEAESRGVPLVTLEDLLKRSDILTIHTPLTSETRSLFNSSLISKMRENSILVNAARGEIVVEKHVIAALDEGHLRTYAADVFEVEPLDPKHPLAQHSKAIISPHMAAQSEEAQAKVSVAAAHQIVQYFKSGEIKNRVEDFS